MCCAVLCCAVCVCILMMSDDECACVIRTARRVACVWKSEKKTTTMTMKTTLFLLLVKPWSDRRHRHRHCRQSYCVRRKKWRWCERKCSIEPLSLPFSKCLFNPIPIEIQSIALSYAVQCYAMSPSHARIKIHQMETPTANHLRHRHSPKRGEPRWRSAVCTATSYMPSKCRRREIMWCGHRNARYWWLRGWCLWNNWLIDWLYNCRRRRFRDSTLLISSDYKESSNFRHWASVLRRSSSAPQQQQQQRFRYSIYSSLDNQQQTAVDMKFVRKRFF